MTKKQKRSLMVTVGILISIFLLWTLFRNIELARLWQVLKAANYLWLIPNVLLTILTMHQRAKRWQTMVRPIKKVAYSKMISATCVGFMANNVLPLRLGEFVRAYSLSWQDKDISKSSALGNIFVERMVFELFALLTIFGIVLGLFGLPWSDQLQWGLSAAVGVALVGLVIIIVLALRPERASNLIVKYLFFLPSHLDDKIKDIVLKFSQGLEFLTNSRMVISVAFQTMGIWLLLGLSNYFVFQAFGFDLPLSASYVLLVVVSIFILVPSSPGFVGVYHTGAVVTLTAYGIEAEDALSFALVLHAAQYIPVTLMGFYYLKKEHLSLRKLEDEAVDEVS